MFMPRMRAAYHAFAEDRARRSAVRTLAGLNDTMLKDIGISRSQIETVIDGLPYRGGRMQA